MKLIKYLLPTFFLSVSLFTQAREIILSEKPISLRMPIGKEYIIRFPISVIQTELLDPIVANSVSQLLSPDGIMYLTANEAFTKTRMVAQLVDGRLVMLDLTGAEAGPYDDDNIHIVEKPTAPEPESADTSPPLPERNPHQPEFLHDGGVMTANSSDEYQAERSYHRLVQSAFRQFYGPSRLSGPMLGEKQTVNPASLANLVRLNNNKLQFRILQSQKIGDTYITVLLVNNLSGQAIEFDPRAIRGRWLFAATLHPVIEPAGGQHDRTLWALVSAVPFDQARR